MEIKVSNKGLNKLVKTMADVENQIETFETQIDKVSAELEIINVNIVENDALIDAMASGEIKMDIEKYLNAKHQIVVLAEEKEIKEKALADLNNDFNGLSDALRENAFNVNKDIVLQEYKNNRHELINEMFIKMMEVVELSEQLNDESKKYYDAFQSTEVKRADNYRFETGLGMMWNRFIFNGFGAKYSQAYTSQVLEFEEKYFNK